MKELKFDITILNHCSIKSDHWSFIHLSNPVCCNCNRQTSTLFVNWFSGQPFNGISKPLTSTASSDSFARLQKNQHHSIIMEEG
jgi:hypothetical protein